MIEDIAGNFVNKTGTHTNNVSENKHNQPPINRIEVTKRIL